ncbi:hypothetical protein D9757_004371 [Collybiopsis confluens]|uniref:Superkiller protein 3 n=1 Tax=Collybiopsis confluens TaxID=2823264 RepID=A0A8H5HUA9_9AGAR|nr:hypothetical protein D9757_004371 [Collybiopsis confluens]
MTSIVKTKLKNARDFLGKKNYVGARDAAMHVLDFEPENYNANVFLGLAYLELGQLSESEQAYWRATELNPNQILAWQGLSKFYERTENWEQHATVLRQMADIYAALDDAVKCAETLQRYIEMQRERATPVQLTDALSLFLPDSPLYPVLSTLMPPDSTNPTSTTTFQAENAIHNSLTVIEEIVTILEREEESYMKKEFGKRRTRLNAGPPDQIRKEIGREVWGTSKASLPDLYNQILDHPHTSDTSRRETDSKLLRYKHQYMLCLSSTEDLALKVGVATEIEGMVSGAVLLHIPDDLAWTLYLERKNVETIDAYDLDLFREFMALFPSHTFTILLKGYFIYMQIPSTEKSDEGGVVEEDTDVGYDLILEAHSSLSTSLIATRIVAEIHQCEVDYENAIQTCERGLQLVAKFESENAITLPSVRVGYQAILASSLVHFYPPKHHARALKIVDQILAVSPENIAAVMGRGYILETSENWEEAAETFGNVYNTLGQEHGEGLRAKEEYAWCISRTGKVQAGIDSLQAVLEIMSGLDGHNHDHARCFWRLGKCLWSLKEARIMEGYQNFITALKCDPSYSPAFTSLGIYYSEYANPPDPNRASKCFQKAFELDPREADAAHRLATGFADEQEWDLVDVVVRRTIEGEGGLNGGLQSAQENRASKYLPMNAWAWKALGVVNLVKREYSAAIEALQISLRAEPNDRLTWLRLGEAYLKSGRHSAALKALSHSRDLCDEDDWISAYLIAEVYCQTGQYEEAVNQLEKVLSVHPSELSVLATLAQARLNLGRSELSGGFIARAEQSLLQTIRLSLTLLADSTGFRSVIWKTVVDALYILSTRDTFIDEDAVSSAIRNIRALLGNPSSRIMDVVPPQDHSNALALLQLTVATCDHRIELGSSEEVIASAYYDLAVALRSLAQKTPDGEKKMKAIAQASKALIEAIRKFPVNDSYWIALGDLNFAENPKTAQHAYIRALEIDSKNAGTWANMGLLFFHHNDIDLANEAFYRAQSADPDCTVAWLGQALVAMASGHSKGATSILEHAIGLSNIVPEADYQYTSRAFIREATSSGSQAMFSPDALLPAFFVLDRYTKYRPQDPTAFHLYALVCERIGHMERGVELITRAIALLEALYEQTEDTEIERQFTIAHMNTGRLKLSIQDYEGALESFETTLGLLSEENDETTVLLRVQSQFGSGIAHFRMGNLEGALGLLETALDSATDNSLLRGEVSVMLSQTLWTMGTSECKDQAKNLLLECISVDPENLVAINTLAAMGILTEDETLIDAALSEILALPVDRRLRLDPLRDVDHLMIQHGLGQREKNNSEKALGVAQKAVFADPASHETRNQAAVLLFQMHRHDSILPALTGPSSETLAEHETSLRLRAAAQSVNGNFSSAVHLAQKNVMMRPSSGDNWRILALANATGN